MVLTCDRKIILVSHTQRVNGEKLSDRAWINGLVILICYNGTVEKKTLADETRILFKILV